MNAGFMERACVLVGVGNEWDDMQRVLEGCQHRECRCDDRMLSFARMLIREDLVDICASCRLPRLVLSKVVSGRRDTDPEQDATVHKHKGLEGLTLISLGRHDHHNSRRRGLEGGQIEAPVPSVVR